MTQLIESSLFLNEHLYLYCTNTIGKLFTHYLKIGLHMYYPKQLPSIKKRSLQDPFDAGHNGWLHIRPKNNISIMFN